MATARGIGAFAEGFAQGYGQMSEIEARRAAMERDKQRLGLEEQRAVMDKERFALDKQQAELGMKQTTMQIAAAQREEDFQRDLTKSLSDLQMQREAGYEGEIIDTRTGQSQGFKRFQNPDQEIGAMKERGLAFKPGTIKQVAAMDPLEYQMKFGDVFLGAHARAGKLDPKMLADARAQRKQIESEGAIDAARFFMTTGDQQTAKDMFNKAGKIKIGADVQLQVENDPIVGPKVIGVRGGKKIFDMFDDVILPSMSADAYGKVQADMRKLGIEQKQENIRAGQAAKAAMDRTVYEANARMIAANKDKGDGDAKDLYKYTLEFAGKFASNPSFTWDGGGYMRWATTVAARAEQYRQKGMSIPEAAAKATTEIPVPEAVAGKKK